MPDAPGTVRYELYTEASVWGPALGALAGALLQRLADPTTTRAAWLRAAPWLALAAAILSTEVAWTDRLGEPHSPTPFCAARYPLLGPIGVVALVQIAAAVAGRGRPAPLARAARWTQAGLFVALLAWDFVRYVPSDPRPATAFGAGVLVLAGALLAARREGLPGGALVVAGAYAGARTATVLAVWWNGWRIVNDWIVETAFLAAMVPLAAILVRASRMDRRSLARLGIDVGPPADLYVAFWAAGALADEALTRLGPATLDREAYTWYAAARCALAFAAPFAVAGALRYLRRVLDVLAVREALRRAPPAPPARAA